jgi:hypothetical protein
MNNDGTIIATLITDRTKADAERVKTLAAKIRAKTATAEEVQEYLSDLKGAYNVSDLNRVGNAMNFIADKLRSVGIAVEVSPKTDWEQGDLTVTAAQAAHYLSDIQTLRSMLSVYPTTPTTPDSLDTLTFETANNIEQILVDLYDICLKTIAGFRHSGMVYSNQGGLIA